MKSIQQQEVSTYMADGGSMVYTSYIKEYRETIHEYEINLINYYMRREACCKEGKFELIRTCT